MVGGFVRLLEIPEIIRVGAPVHKVRPAQCDVYPAGTHLDTTTVALRRERVRRARLGLDVLQRSGAEFITSKLGAEGLTVPDPTLRASSSERATANRSTDVTP